MLAMQCQWKVRQKGNFGLELGPRNVPKCLSIILLSLITDCSPSCSISFQHNKTISIFTCIVPRHWNVCKISIIQPEAVHREETQANKKLKASRPIVGRELNGISKFCRMC